MQMPFSICEPAEEPEVVASGGFDPVVVAAVGAAAPPAGLDPLGTPVASDAMGLILKFEGNRRTVGDDGDGRERLGRMMKKKGQSEINDLRVRIIH